ncbi:pilus assembly protein [Pseudactinotalea sp. HY158]|uniref:pilus assembly protein n=1 Tax=Pseudactinotalea sp. HY158 TaxID=2654547 RepID=UPI00129C96B9|nr:pilus assembly protein [Pseudactinotalea sp. HY158]QGH69145.1 pilus assembly protein [Pseudactinotalea sp. HY158]
MTGRPLARLRARLARVAAGGDSGSAVVEFLGVTLLLLVPTVYLVLTLARVEAAAFAAEGAAREAGRIIAAAESMDDALVTMHQAVELAFADQGIDVDPQAAVAVTCSDDPCLSPGAYVHVAVAATVDLPLLPDVVADATRSSVRIEASATTGIDRFRERP